MANSNTVPFKVITPEGTVFEKEVAFGRFPGQAGELGVYPNHSATLSELKEGFITLMNETNEKQHFFVSKGLLHIRPDFITLMTPYIEAQESIDKNRAEEAKKRALARLKSEEKDINKHRAQQSLMRAEERLFTLLAI